MLESASYPDSDSGKEIALNILVRLVVPDSKVPTDESSICAFLDEMLDPDDDLIDWSTPEFPYFLFYITDLPKENCCSVLFISKKRAKNISVLQKNNCPDSRKS